MKHYTISAELNSKNICFEVTAPNIAEALNRAVEYLEDINLKEADVWSVEEFDPE